MNVYTLVRLKSNLIGYSQIVKLRPLDNSIVSQVKRACIRLIEFELDFAFCTEFSPGAVSQKETVVVLLSPLENEKQRFI